MAVIKTYTAIAKVKQRVRVSIKAESLEEANKKFDSGAFEIEDDLELIDWDLIDIDED